MAKKNKQPTAAEIKAEIKETWDRWNHILKHGCSDPSWPDGTNMNLVRNHIINAYRQLDELEQAEAQMSLFDEPATHERDIPPKVPENFMSPTSDYPNRPHIYWGSFGGPVYTF